MPCPTTTLPASPENATCWADEGPALALEGLRMRRAWIGAAVVGLLATATPANAGTVDHVVDGDTIQLASGPTSGCSGTCTPRVATPGWR